MYYFNYRPDFEQAKFSCGTIVCEVNGFAIACSSTGYCAPHGSSKKIDGNGFVFKLNWDYVPNGTAWAKWWEQQLLVWVTYTNSRYEFQFIASQTTCIVT